MNKENAHATLSPSTAERWFNCPGSLRISRGKRSVSGPAAIKGTEAHSFASEILLENATLEDIEDDVMRTAVRRYVEFVNELEASYSEDPNYLVEEQVSLRHLGGDCWGTADYASWVAKEDLYVVDYKNGMVPVEAKDNKQMKIYALGILEDVGYDFKNVYTVIVQPNAAHVNGPIRSERLTMDSMKVFRKQLISAMEETKDEYASLAAGPWCQYCPAIGHCPEIIGEAQDLARIEFADNSPGNDNLPSLESITNDQLTRIIAHSRIFRAWLDSCQQEAVERIAKGSELNGLKLVRSPGRARWKDPNNLPKEFTRSVPITITEARTQFEDVEEYIERPEGSIVAVPDTDGRALYISPQVEFD